MTGGMPARREKLHRRGVRLEVFTIAWNVVEGFVAIGAGPNATATEAGSAENRALYLVAATGITTV